MALETNESESGTVKTESNLFVVLGATGDLVHRKLLPALFQVFTAHSVGEESLILGVGVETDIDDARFREMAAQSLVAGDDAEPSEARAWCERYLRYQPIGQGTTADYQALAARISALEESAKLTGNRVLYLALPPAVFEPAIRGLGEAGLNRSRGWTRLVIEKPFGRDLDSARQLNRTLHEWFEERQIYRIDHYLGKETVKNLLAFRFANALFESSWNRDRIERVEILVAESLGVEHRAVYYEKAGAVRDMMQNHLTQLLTIVAMELPAAFDADAIRYEKAKLLRAVQPIDCGDVVFGQYVRGSVDGSEAPGYREEPGVNPDSQAETFAALRLRIDNWRWFGVPFYLRTGKRMPRRLSQIVVTFRAPPLSIFKPLPCHSIHSNALVFTIQPDEGFDLNFEVKSPGQGMTLETERLHFRYSEAFAPLLDAYHTLLTDILTGDQTLFVSALWAELSWALYTPLLENRPLVEFYAAGTWGPAAAERLIRGEAPVTGNGKTGGGRA
ncbi:MAG: glucose-6-phosphate dehydrogenase [Bryobacteraceae bacterium]